MSSIQVPFTSKTGISVSNAPITNVADPVNPQDAATKSYSSNVNNINYGVLDIAYGGTGQTSFGSGYLISNGTAIGVTASIDASIITGDITGNAANVTGIVAVVNGGTGATTAGDARLNLSAASSGANSDITGLSGLTTALSVAQGGTGVKSFSSGYLKSDGTSLTSSSTILGTDITGNIGGNATNVTGTVAVANGGTGATDATTARTNLTAAKSGANSDITSLTGLTTALSVAQGGTGATTSTGSGNVVLSNSPTLTTPDLGTPSAVTLTNATELPLNTGVTGTLAIANGGTGATTSAEAANNLLPSQTGNDGKVLSTDGSGNLSWILMSTGGALDFGTFEQPAGFYLDMGSF